MGSIYGNSDFILSPVASDENCSQYKGNSNEDPKSEREFTSPKWTKVLLIVLSVSLVFALGGICIMGIMYSNVSTQLSLQENNNTIMVGALEELKANYTRVREHLCSDETVTDRELREHLRFYKVFTDQSQNIAAFGGTLYFFSSDKLNWTSSRAFCVSKGADLVTITSKSQQIFLMSKVNDFHWIGLNDLDTEGRWVWVNGQTLTETGVQFWHKTEPDNWRVQDPTRENCAHLKNGFNYSISWFDISCKYEMKCICAKKF